MYDKCLDFSVRMVKLGRFLQNEKHDFVIYKQIVGSGTGVGPTWRKHNTAPA